MTQTLETSLVTPQITLPDLLVDPEYKAFFSSKPSILPRTSSPWRAWLQRSTGKWSFVQFDSYVKAHNHIIRLVREKEIVDGALACLAVPTPRFIVVRGKKPVMTDSGRKLLDPKTKKPVMVDRRVKWPMPEFHLWCPYCRRPTRWGYYPRGHRAIGKRLSDCGSELRCRICGVRQSFVAIHHGIRHVN